MVLAARLALASALIGALLIGDRENPDSTPTTKPAPPNDGMQAAPASHVSTLDGLALRREADAALTDHQGDRPRC